MSEENLVSVSPRPLCVERAALTKLIVQMRTLELALVFSLFLLLTSLFVEEFHMTKKCRWKIPLYIQNGFFDPELNVMTTQEFTTTR